MELVDGQPIAVIPYIRTENDNRPRWPLAMPFGGKRKRPGEPDAVPEAV